MDAAQRSGGHGWGRIADRPGAAVAIVPVTAASGTPPGLGSPVPRPAHRAPAVAVGTPVASQSNPAPSDGRRPDSSKHRPHDPLRRLAGRDARAVLPPARAWVSLLAQATVEVLAGTRPISQLQRWTSDEVFAYLSRQAAPGRVRQPGPAPWRMDQRPGRPTVRALRLCQPADGVVEACAVVADGSRASALAFRLESMDGRWRCTRLDRV